MYNFYGQTPCFAQIDYSKDAIVRNRFNTKICQKICAGTILYLCLPSSYIYDTIIRIQLQWTKLAPDWNNWGRFGIRTKFITSIYAISIAA